MLLRYLNGDLTVGCRVKNGLKRNSNGSTVDQLGKYRSSLVVRGGNGGLVRVLEVKREREVIYSGQLGVEVT